MRDLEAVGDHIARDKPAAAARLVARIFAEIDRLADFPYSGRSGRIAGTRELVISGTPYVAAYRLREKEVEILAIFHAARRSRLTLLSNPRLAFRL